MTKFLYDYDWAGAEEEFRRATELNPADAMAHHFYAVRLDCCDDGATAFARPKPTVPITTPGSVPTVAVGKWLAYTSDESGRREVYVQSFPTGGGKWQVSTSGGSDPRWRGDGRELFYFSQGKLVAVPISVGASFEAGVPVALFEANTGAHVFAVDPSGQRFLILAPLGKSAPPMTVMLDWTAGLAK